MNPLRSTRRGFSLMEVAAAVALMGFITTVAVISVRIASLSNYGAEVDVRELSTALHDARRRTISSGVNHGVVFRKSGGNYTHFTISRREAAGWRAIEEPRAFSRDVRVAVQPPVAPEFNFEGDALGTHTIYVSGERLRWKLSVMQAGGGILVQKVN